VNHTSSRDQRGVAPNKDQYFYRARRIHFPLFNLERPSNISFLTSFLPWFCTPTLQAIFHTHTHSGRSRQMILNRISMKLVSRAVYYEGLLTAAILVTNALRRIAFTWNCHTPPYLGY